MSVSRIEVSRGRVVSSDSAATTASKSNGRRPSPCARNVSASIQTVSADCSSSTRQNASGTPALRIRP
jgi:hypothetical protein